MVIGQPLKFKFLNALGNSEISRRTVLLAGTAAVSAFGIGKPALSRQRSQNCLGAGPVYPLRPMQSKLTDSVSIKDYGAIGDGKGHPLGNTARFNEYPTSGWTLSEWQEIFPFATALTNEIDGLAIQAAARSARSNSARPLRVSFCLRVSHSRKE